MNDVPVEQGRTSTSACAVDRPDRARHRWGEQIEDEDPVGAPPRRAT